MPDTQQTERRTIAVIDGNSLMHRAFHAIPPTMNAPDGRPTNAIFGFLNMFMKMIETFEPNGIICAFDKGKPKSRMELLPQYKAQRPPMDQDLRTQFPMIKELLGALDVPVVELEGWEGDDILGTLAKRGEAAGYDMLLITGDRDMYQLSTEHVKIVGTKKGLSEVSIMTPESVEDLYHGITPELVPDFYGLKGDSSDNIPGVPGIGPKKASALITQYGSLDEVIAHADEIPGKMGQNLREHIEDALLSRTIATIMCDAPIELDLADAHFPTFDPERARQALADLGFTSMQRRITSLAAQTPGAQALSPAFEIPEVLSGQEAYDALEQALEQGQWLGCVVDDDTGADGFFGFTTHLWLSTDTDILHIDDDHTLELLARLVREAKLVAFDMKALLHYVVPVDSTEAALVSMDQLDPERMFDLKIAAYLLDSDSSSFEPDELLGRYLDTDMPETSDTHSLHAIHAAITRALREPLATALEQDGSDKLFEAVEMPLLAVLLEMERTGLYADSTRLAEQSAELGTEIDTMVAHIHKVAGQSFNIDSPQQLSHVLFDVLKLPTDGLKKTRTGFYSTNAKVLGELAAHNDLVAEVLEYRERAKIKSTYLDALPQLIRKDGRIHTSFNQTVAATGRLSSSEPNLQNIPTRSALGHRVRTAFTVPEGHVFLACDYSQIELRLLAHLSADEHLIAAFNEGADFHASTAARVFGVDPSEVNPEMRSRAKAVNFGIVYGQQAFGLASSLKISRKEAQEMIDRYFEVYPGVREFLDRQVAFARANGWVATLYGRKRHIKEIKSSNFQQRSFGERTAMNHPMQGTAADIIKLAMIRVSQRMRAEGLQSKLVLQIHDELDFEVPTDEIEYMSALVSEEMQGVVELSVPLTAEVSYGPTWAEAK
ncbi:MAG: DNA polymerase I [Atopobiaceae bacterium]|nr:DNA polymerase I [Atopobiaceae bacterium]